MPALWNPIKTTLRFTIYAKTYIFSSVLLELNGLFCNMYNSLEFSAWKRFHMIKLFSKLPACTRAFQRHLGQKFYLVNFCFVIFLGKTSWCLINFLQIFKKEWKNWLQFWIHWSWGHKYSECHKNLSPTPIPSERSPPSRFRCFVPPQEVYTSNSVNPWGYNILEIPYPHD